MRITRCRGVSLVRWRVLATLPLLLLSEKLWFSRPVVLFLRVATGRVLPLIVLLILFQLFGAFLIIFLLVLRRPFLSMIRFPAIP